MQLGLILLLLVWGCEDRKERSILMNERTGVITFKGSPLTLVGPELKVGQPLPDATLIANDLSPVELSSYKGKTIIISTVPSLDTGICDLQTKRFNVEAGNLGNDVVVLTISEDLPFAQTRWCGAADAKNVVTLSDYKERAFAQASGLYIKELALLTRSVIIVDKEGVVQYIQVVPEVATEPDYESVLKALKDI